MLMPKRQRRHLRKRPVAEDASDDETVVQKKAKQTREPKPEKRAQDSVFAVEGDRSVQCETDQGATRQLETETEFDRDAR